MGKPRPRLSVSGLTWQRNVSYEEAGKLFRAMHGDKDAQQTVTLEDVQDLIWAPTFGEFLERNRGILSVYESAS